MKLRIALAASTALALAACGSADDASTEAEPDTVEMPATEALEEVTEEPVADEEAALPAEPTAAEEAAQQRTIEEAGDTAAADAAAVADALEGNE